MTKPDLRVVPRAAEAAPFDDKKGRKRIQILRTQLLRAAARYVSDGRTDENGKPSLRGDRLREASNLSGIPLKLIDVEARKR